MFTRLSACRGSYILIHIYLTAQIINRVLQQVVQEYERAVIFRLGRLMTGGAKGPGEWTHKYSTDTDVFVMRRTVRSGPARNVEMCCATWTCVNGNKQTKDHSRRCSCVWPRSTYSRYLYWTNNSTVYSMFCMLEFKAVRSRHDTVVRIVFARFGYNSGRTETFNANVFLVYKCILLLFNTYRKFSAIMSASTKVLYSTIQKIARFLSLSHSLSLFICIFLISRPIGIFFILPCIDAYARVDLRTRTYDVPPQEVSVTPGAKGAERVDLARSTLRSQTQRNTTWWAGNGWCSHKRNICWSDVYAFKCRIRVGNMDWTYINILYSYTRWDWQTKHLRQLNRFTQKENSSRKRIPM